MPFEALAVQPFDVLEGKTLGAIDEPDGLTPLSEAHATPFVEIKLARVDHYPKPIFTSLTPSVPT
jgi:hypothetical protein